MHAHACTYQVCCCIKLLANTDQSYKDQGLEATWEFMVLPSTA